MNFGFTEEQDLLRSEVHKFLAGRCPLGEVRRIGEEQAGFCATLWSEIAGLGWPGLVIAEAGSESQQAAWLPSLATGEQFGALALYEQDDAIEARHMPLRACRQPDARGRAGARQGTLAAQGTQLARDGDRRRDAQHPEEHHRRATAGFAEGLAPGRWARPGLPELRRLAKLSQ